MAVVRRLRLLHPLEHARFEVHHEANAVDGRRDAHAGVVEDGREDDERDCRADCQQADSAQQEGEDGAKFHVL